MTISAYTGLPGHGKSYGVVENVIIPALKAKRRIFTNIPMIHDLCMNHFQFSADFFDISDIVNNENWWSDVFEPGSLIVLDEIWRLWPSGVTAKNIRHSDKSFLAEHRHLVGSDGFSTEIFLVTQDLSQCAAFVRDLVDTTYRVTKLSSIGSDNRFRVDVYSGAVKGQHLPASKRLREIFGTFKPDVYQYYKSHTKSEVGAGDETRIDKRRSIFGGFQFKLLFFAFIFSILIIWVSLPKLMTLFGFSDSPDLVAQQPGPASHPASVSQKPVQSVSVKFLGSAKSVYISYNRGVYPNVNYRVTVVMTDTISDFTLTDLKALGYTAIAVNQCAIKIQGSDFNQIAMCQIYTPPDKSDTVKATGSSISDAASI